ncbi:hypothetical protein KHQ08_09395 [Pseudochrobactrum algeriensis]|uniref:hypothetical protein n=1 Tax=Pseudochrobactrum algeriensis TaxID=2834768 RepID=UPI001BD05AFB|nr:hypothetical protein [Pseudochrobactrum algeriensis]QVQ38170.1 hypothetical protein KHQ08_09395 [Pseudochrobactrum algeriensis]QVQ41396.1 hypothetical protein KHQ07_07700 [Pseudochrobactrum algeriensis]QVQ45318.1 hypothetical protein KHQ09_09655 [Pseudochrobactrum algeriensis]
MSFSYGTERSESPKHEKISKTLKFNYSLKGRRKLLAQAERIRCKAQRLGLSANKSGTIGGWSLKLWRYGEIIAGPQLYDDEIEKILDDLMKEESPRHRQTPQGSE